MNTPTEDSAAEPLSRGGYWSKSLRVVYIVLSIWLFVSLGCGILFRKMLDAWLPNIGGAPFGFWMAQQGSIICFVFVLIAYAILMSKLDKKYGYDEASSNGKETK